MKPRNELGMFTGPDPDLVARDQTIVEAYWHGIQHYSTKALARKHGLSTSRVEHILWPPGGISPAPKPEHRPLNSKVNTRSMAYCISLMGTRDYTRADEAFASRQRNESPAFEIGEKLARCFGDIHQVMEENGYGNDRLDRLLASMAAQVHAQLADHEDGK